MSENSEKYLVLPGDVTKHGLEFVPVVLMSNSDLNIVLLVPSAL